MVNIPYCTVDKSVSSTGFLRQAPRDHQKLLCIEARDAGSVSQPMGRKNIFHESLGYPRNTVPNNYKGDKGVVSSQSAQVE